MPTGGSTATGGSQATGGSSNATGGNTPTGGSSAVVLPTGGNAATGGSSAVNTAITGGNSSTGGSSATGGNTATGDSSTALPTCISICAPRYGCTIDIGSIGFMAACNGATYDDRRGQATVVSACMNNFHTVAGALVCTQ